MLLAIDSASQWMSMALYDGQQIVAEQTQRSHNQHTVQLSAHLQRLLQEQGLTPSDLKALAIAQGVGSYSGLRVGFGVAKGLALALHLPLIPIPTLAITALGTPFFEGKLIAVVTAGRQRILAQAYHWSGDAWQASHDPTNTTWEVLIPNLSAPTLVNGEIDPAGQVLLTQAGLSLLPPAYRVRRAAFLAQAAWERFIAHEYPPHSAQVMPLYVSTP